MAMNKVYMAFTLVFLFSLLAISMVESRTLTDILEKIRPAKAAASTSMEAKSKLNGAFPRNLEPDTGKPSRPIRTNDATPIMMKVDRTKPIWLPKYLPTWLIDNSESIMVGDDNIDAESTQVTDQPKGTATFETEPTPVIVANSMMRSSLTESVTNYTQCDTIDEIQNTNAESTKNVQSTQVIDQPEGTTIVGTEQTHKSIANSTMRNLPAELVTNYSTPSSGYEEIPRTETSSSIDADSYVVDADTLNGAVPRNLKVDVGLRYTESLRPISSSKSLRTIDSTPTSVANSVIRTSLEPVTDYSQTSVIEEDSKTGDESTEYVKSTEVTSHPEGTTTVETESAPMSVSNSTMLSSRIEVPNYTQSSVVKEIQKTNTDSTKNVKTVPRAIGAHVFYGKMVSGSEMYNMTTDEYYNKIYPTHNCDVFLIGKLLKVADTQHNRMVFAKFAEEEADSTSDDDSTEGGVPLDK